MARNRTARSYEMLYEVDRKIYTAVIYDARGRSINLLRGRSRETVEKAVQREWPGLRQRKTTHGNAMTRRGYLKAFTVQRVPLDRGGYTSRGRYFGAGAPLYRVEHDDGEYIRELYVRAHSAREARAEALKRPGHWGGWR